MTSLRRLGLAPVALHDVVAADGDLAHPVRLVGELHLHALDRRPDRPRLALTIGVVERRDRRGLAEARTPSSTLQPNFSSKPRRISTGSAAPPETQTCSDEVSWESTALSSAAYMVEHALEDVHVVALDDLERLPPGRSANQRQAAA
jgi:hypothetical protein